MFLSDRCLCCWAAACLVCGRLVVPLDGLGVVPVTVDHQRTLNLQTELVKLNS